MVAAKKWQKESQQSITIFTTNDKEIEKHKQLDFFFLKKKRQKVLLKSDERQMTIIDKLKLECTCRSRMYSKIPSDMKKLEPKQKKEKNK